MNKMLRKIEGNRKKKINSLRMVSMGIVCSLLREAEESEASRSAQVLTNFGDESCHFMCELSLGSW